MMDGRCSWSEFVDQFKISVGSYSYEDQMEICVHLQPYVNFVLEHHRSPYERQTKQIQMQLRLLVKNNPLFDSEEVRLYFEKIIENTKVLTFDSQRLDFYIKTRVLINFNNMFVVVRAYDGCCEGGGHCDIHIKESCSTKGNSSSVQLFKKNNFENALADLNDEELLQFYDRLILNNNNSPIRSGGIGGSLSDCIITFEQFKVFVAELFLSDFDY